MAKYLDQTGLKYFWGKIKAKMPGPLQAYPVGSVYISISSNFNPNTSFGGKWERFGQGRTLIGEGTGDDGVTRMTFTANSTGGLYINPVYRKDIGYLYYGALLNRNGDQIGVHDHNEQMKAEIPSLQPYITVYFWKRTA